MNVYIFFYCFILILLLSDFCIKRQRNIALAILGTIVILFVGLRGETGADSQNYIDFFNFQTNTFYKWEEINKGYAEYGFYFLSVLLKTIYNNIDFYFLVIAAITTIPLIKSLNYMCIYPVLGYCVYYSRFMIIRDMNQIRQALAIALIIYGLRFLIENKKKLFWIITVICISLHYSMIIIIPFIYLYNLKLNFKQCIFLIISGGVIGIIGGYILKAILIATNNIVLLRYVNTMNLGIFNPVLIFQCVICLIFFYYEPIISLQQKGYYIIRNAYLYSVILLLLTCNLGEIGGRLATVFATCEIFILPALSCVVKPRIAGYIISLALTALLFFMNYMKLIQESYLWSYF